MRALSPLAKKKRGLSNIVAYVLLISITISLSVLVYGWLRFYVSGEDIEACSDNVNLIIRDYQCSIAAGGSGSSDSLVVTLKNKGLFNVDGYELRVHNEDYAEFGIYLLDESGDIIKPGAEHKATYNLSNPKYYQDIDGDGDMDDQLDDITLLEIQPFVYKDGTTEDIRCKSYSSQRIICGG